MTSVPETRYARAADVHVAYQVLGDGPVDILLCDQWFSHMDGQWDVPQLAEFRRRLAGFSRLILFDKRGVGLSDPVALGSLPSLEAWMDDVLAVMDASGSERAAVITNIGAAMTGLVFAATHPDRVRSLVVVDGFARFLAADDYQIGESVEQMQFELDQIEVAWGRGLMLDVFAPTMRNVPGLRESWARYERMAGSPGSAQAMVRNIYETDVRDVLAAIQAPTLVMQHPDGRFPAAFGRFIADHVTDARYLELAGPDQLIWAGDQDATVAEIEEFVTGVRPAPVSTRVLATILFTDMVDSTGRAAALGDRAWRGVLDEHDRLIRRAVADAAGQFIKSTGDGALATFDGPARAIRAAQAIRTALGAIGLPIRAGLHTGEIELLPTDIAGVAVHIASRVAAMAGTSEILVSSTVKELVVGSGIAFEDRGRHALRGVPDDWQIYAVVSD